MKVSRSSVANNHGLDGILLPPKRWKTKLYGFFGLVAPDRWVPFKD
jgi:hypothetical protein